MDDQHRGTIGLGKSAGSGPADRETIRIRGYQVGEFLGRGGFGDVWKGTRLHPGPTTVAIKVLRNRLAGDRDLERFRRESMILGRLEHPAIATVFDAGTLDDGRPWFAMEFVDGSSLGDVVRDGLPIEEALEIMEGVCRGVGHAHAKGIIHCDLKPENILVSHIDGQWRPKVIDFGVATAIEGDEPGRTCLRSTDVMPGTPEYMAPEQLASGEVDTRVDVWALGVILSEVVSGRRPFEVSAEDGGVLEEQRRIRTEEATSPSRGLGRLERRDAVAAAEIAGRRGTSTRALIRVLRRDIDWMVLRCLERDPDGRYPSVSALGDELGRHRRHEPLEAGPPNVGYRAKKFIRRNRLPVGLVALVLLVLFAGLLGTGFGLVRAVEARQVAESRLSGLVEMTDFGREILTSVNPTVAQGLDNELMLQMLERSRGKIRDSGNLLVRSQLLFTLAQAWAHLGEYELALETGRESLGLARSSLEAAGPTPQFTDPKALSKMEGALAMIMNNAARRLPTEQKAEMRGRAEEMFNRVIAFDTDTLGAEHRDTLRNRINLGSLLLQSPARRDEGLEMIRSVHEIRVRILGPDHERALSSASLLSDALIRLKRYEEARTMLLGLFGESPDTTGAELGSQEVLLLNNLAVAESRLGNTSERFRLLDGISDRVEPLFGAENTVALTLLYNHGTTLLDRGRLSEAEARFRRCLDGFEARTSPGSMQRIRSRGRLAQSVMLQGLLEDESRCDEAMRLFIQMENAALDLATNAAAATSTRMRSWGDAAAAASKRASIARRIGRLDEAREAISGAEDHLARVTPGSESMLDGLVAAERLRFESDPVSTRLVSRIEASIETLSTSRRRECAIMTLALAEHDRVKRGENWFADQCLEIEEMLSADSSPSADLIRLDLDALGPTRVIDGD
ncbi:MAG: hypothetical protein CMJ51_03535 [Planctomycetaceae bacterium]|nr:hypothetical protein [Planctomycetaceae bacterium]